MSRLLARIELHDIDQEDPARRKMPASDAVHAVIKKMGFQRIVQGDSRRYWHMPLATYWRKKPGNENLQGVAGEIQDAVKTIWQQSGVIVCAVDNLSWTGLKEASKQEYQSELLSKTVRSRAPSARGKPEPLNEE